MGKGLRTKIRYVMVGNCPACGEEFKRKPPVDAAVCMCTVEAAERKGLNPLPEPIVIPLKSAIVLSNREHANLTRIATLAEIRVEDLVNALLIEIGKEKLDALQPFPQLVVTTRGQV